MQLVLTYEHAHASISPKDGHIYFRGGGGGEGISVDMGVCILSHRTSWIHALLGLHELHYLGYVWYIC